MLNTDMNEDNKNIYQDGLQILKENNLILKNSLAQWPEQ